VVLFTESSFHGTLPWAAASERRVGLYRFAPATMAYGRAYFPQWCVRLPRVMGTVGFQHAWTHGNGHACFPICTQ